MAPTPFAQDDGRYPAVPVYEIPKRSKFEDFCQRFDLPICLLTIGGGLWLLWWVVSI